MDENETFELSDDDLELLDNITLSDNEEVKEIDVSNELTEEKVEEKPTVSEASSKIERTKTGKVKRKVSEETRQRLRAQLAKGRAKSLENRRKNKKLKEIKRSKDLDEQDKILLEELQSRKSNKELKDEIANLKKQLEGKSIPEKEIIIPPKPEKKKTGPTPETAILKQQKKISSHLPLGFSLAQLRSL